MKELIIGLLCAGLVLGAPRVPKATCGYDACPKPVAGKLNVHLIAHTHNDPGWINTMEQHYYHSVQYILDTVVENLLKDPTKRFSYTETAYFWKWWQQQTPEDQEKVRGLVASGQLEFVGGAWTMNDEATVNYQSVVDQFTYGLRKLNDTFGACALPRVAWQVDAFGHSQQMASQLAQSGYDGVFLSRVDYNDKNKRLSDKAMEMVWEADSAIGASGDLFAHILYNHYTSANNFCWDMSCGWFDEALVPYTDSTDYNLPRIADNLIDFGRKQREGLNTDNVIAPIGGDFHFVNAAINFKNIDIVIKEVNSRQSNGSNVNVFYSTPSCYLKAVNDAAPQLPTKQDDFFPFESEGHTFWTGFYSSRPSYKLLERQGNSVLQSAKRLASFTSVDPARLEELKSAVAVAQHHQAITGTSKQFVADDFAWLLTKAIASGENVIRSAINEIAKAKNPQAVDLGLESCRLRNISECSVTADKNSFLVTVYNPSNVADNRPIRLPVQNASYTVTDSNGQVIQSQLVPIPDAVSLIPGRNSNTKVELVFVATSLPPLGFTSYYVTKTGDSPQNYAKVWTPQAGQQVSVGYDDTTIDLDPTTGLLKSVKHGIFTYDLKQSLQYYSSADGSNQDGSNRASGAYIFRPKEQSPQNVADKATVTVVEGNIVTEIHQTFTDSASQVIRIYQNTLPSQVFEIEYLVGPIDTSNGGQEVITKYETPLATDGVFYTDSNGRGSVERRRNFRPTWDVQLDEPVSGNYYPVSSHITVDDSFSTLAIVTDRAQGGSSLQDGNIELMLHRRLTADDNIGVQETLDEKAFGQGLVVRTTHKVLMTSTGTGVENDLKTRQLEQKTQDPAVLISDVTGRSQQQVASDYVLQWSPLDGSSNVADTIRVLSLEPWREGQLLARFENFGTTESSIDITKLFATINVTAARETTLAAQRFIEDSQRLSWKKKATEEAEVLPQAVDLSNININPQQIRTFILDVTKKV